MHSIFQQACFDDNSNSNNSNNNSDHDSDHKINDGSHKQPDQIKWALNKQIAFSWSTMLHFRLRHFLTFVNALVDVVDSRHGVVIVIIIIVVVIVIIIAVVVVIGHCHHHHRRCQLSLLLSFLLLQSTKRLFLSLPLFLSLTVLWSLSKHWLASQHKKLAKKSHGQP